MYYGGKGVTQNYETAIKWYKLAAKQGLAKAQNHLERLQKKNSQLEKDRKPSPTVTAKKSSLEKVEEQCAEIGFTKGTEKFGDCVMKLLN